ncbi:pyrimidine utilization protein D [Sinorhizobium sp. BG8]|uniref:pyrimidine utilization protein D n=1 Tax=Sinorhizobium sp. BG8 TaxID=2613773 RepID=UPI00193D9BB7|nr:pyrimidine utilization protein D [Sinorhizobium sp. BG8]QRM57014.1 pyrimidine utilization protein D [Sinorhizobium sp. BG8]
MHFEVHGLQGKDVRTVILSSGLGGAGSYWAEQMEVLCPHFRVVTYDHRGTGRTGGSVPENGGISAMADDVMEIARALDLSRFDFVGHALGGLIGLDLALRFPSVLDRLVVINGWSKVSPHSERCFDTRITLLKAAGVPAFVKAQPIFLYPARWMSENAARLAADEAHGIVHFQGETNVLRRIAALRAFDVDERLGEIGAQTLVIATEDDILVPYTRSLRLAEGLPHARLVLTASGGHAVNVTEAQSFNRALTDFLLSDASQEAAQ